MQNKCNLETEAGQDAKTMQETAASSNAKTCKPGNGSRPRCKNNAGNAASSNAKTCKPGNGSWPKCKTNTSPAVCKTCEEIHKTSIPVGLRLTCYLTAVYCGQRGQDHWLQTQTTRSISKASLASTLVFAPAKSRPKHLRLVLSRNHPHRPTRLPPGTHE